MDRGGELSKFIDAVRAEMTGRQYIDHLSRPKLLSVSETYDHCEPVHYNALIEYKVEVSYGMRVVCHPSELTEAKKNVIRSLQEEIYGEFREKAIEVKHALYSGDRDELIKAINELIYEVLG